VANGISAPLETHAILDIKSVPSKQEMAGSEMGQLNSSRSGKPEIAMSQVGQETGFRSSQRHVRTAPKAGQRKMHNCG